MKADWALLGSAAAGMLVLPLLVVAAVMECYVTPQVMQLFM